MKLRRFLAQTFELSTPPSNCPPPPPPPFADSPHGRTAAGIRVGILRDERIASQSEGRGCQAARHWLRGSTCRRGCSSSTSGCPQHGVAKLKRGLRGRGSQGSGGAHGTAEALLLGPSLQLLPRGKCRPPPPPSFSGCAPARTARKPVRTSGLGSRVSPRSTLENGGEARLRLKKPLPAESAAKGLTLSLTGSRGSVHRPEKAPEGSCGRLRRSGEPRSGDATWWGNDASRKGAKETTHIIRQITHKKLRGGALQSSQ